MNIKSSRLFLLFFFFNNLLFAWIPTKFIKSHLNNLAGKTTIIEQNPNRFDATLISDVFHQASEVNSVIIGLVAFCFLLFFLVHTFVLAGFLKHIANRNNQVCESNFINNASKSFLDLLKVQVLFVALYFIVIGLANLLFFRTGLNPFDEISDVAWMKRFFIYNGVAIIICFFIRLWHQNVKISLTVKKEKPLLIILKNAFSQCVNRIWQLSQIQIVFILLSVILASLSLFLLPKIMMGTLFMQWLYIILTQVFILIKIGIRLLELWSFDSVLQN